MRVDSNVRPMQDNGQAVLLALMKLMKRLGMVSHTARRPPVSCCIEGHGE